MHAPEKIAAQIVGEEIRLLTELQEMAGHPRIFKVMCQIVDGARNGRGSTKTPMSATLKPTRDQQAENPSSAPNGLTGEVLGYCERMETGITVAKIVDVMAKADYKFVSKSPKVAVADVIRRYNSTKLKITKQGIGSRPNIYKWIGGTNESA